VGQAKVDRNVALGIRPFLGPTPIRRTLLASPYQLHISAESSRLSYWPGMQTALVLTT